MIKKADLAVLPSLLLGGVFLYSGYHKVVDPLAFAEIVENFRVLPEPLVFPLGLTLACLEVLVGLCLLLGLFVRAAAILSSLLCTVFGIAVTSALVRGIDTACGCFGDGSKVNWWHVALDIFLLGLSVLVLRFQNEPRRLGPWYERSGLGNRLPVVVAIFSLGNVVYGGYAVWSYSEARHSTRHAIVFDAPSIELGEVLQDTVVQRELGFQNLTSEPVIIKSVESGCGCTVPSVSPQQIAPGARGVLSIAYSPGRNLGQNSNLVELYLEGSNEPVEIVVRADIKPQVAAEPEILEFKEVGQTKEVTLKARKPGASFTVTGFEFPGSALKFDVRETSAPGEAELLVQLVEPLPAPPAPNEVWKIQVHTSLPEAPPATLYVRGPKR